jgi:hypothetical protein
MGEPVRIVDMARDLVRLTGRGDDSVPIRFTGLRPGEKLHERLFYTTETVDKTEVDKILRVANTAPPPELVASARRLLELALGDRDDDLRTALFEIVGGWPVSVADDADLESTGPMRPAWHPSMAAEGAAPSASEPAASSDGVPVLT